MIPLLAPKGFAQFEPQEFHDYVRSLYVEPKRAAPPADFTVTLNKQGNPVLRVRRNPKWFSAAEVTAIATDIGWPLQRLWCHILSKKIEIRQPERVTK